MTPPRLLGSLDHSFPWGGGRLLDQALCTPGQPVPGDLCGTAAGVGYAPPARVRLLRDAVGLNKLFWATADDGSVLLAGRPRRLVEAGCCFDNIRAFPPGTITDFDCSRGTLQVTSLRSETWPEFPTDPDLEAVARRIRNKLDRYCAALAAAHTEARAFVCLSGGLDSTGIAVLAREYFTDVVAVSFDLDRPHGRASADRQTAERLARDLHLPLLCVTISEEEVLNFMDCVLTEGIDWRDFNVHAALVNAALAQGIRSSLQDAESEAHPLVMTGDLVNEFLVDYHSETYRHQTFYRLPRLSPGALRSSLVRGLETSHREIGIFEAWGLPVVQLHAVAIDDYLSLPEGFLTIPDRKERLNRLVFGSRIPDYVYNRPKTRAQVGDEDSGRGVLALCADRGLDERWLRQRFAVLHGVRDSNSLDRFIRAGRYRSSVPSLGGPTA